MFTFLCPTCGSKLAVKNEKLIGNILACPKCGSMVLVQPSSDTPPVTPPPNPAVYKRFPDVLSHGTSSGIIGPVPQDNRRSDILLETDLESNVSETEIKTRKFLVGILLGLSIFLLIALGFLMSSRTPVRPPLPEPPKPIIEVPGDQPPAPPMILEPVVPEPIESTEDIDVPIFIEEPAEDTIAEPIPIPEEPVQDTNDASAAWEDKMSNLVDTAVPNIDIAAKLALPILEINFKQRSLIEFVRGMSQMTGIPMTLDIDEMKPLSLSVKTPVEGQFKDTTAEQVLTETLATLGLQWIAADRQILILPKDSADDADLTVDVSDFADKTGDLQPDVLAGMVRQLVCPEANIIVLPDNRLAVVQDEEDRKPNGKSQRRQKDEVLRFLEQLRVVRQLPQKTEWREAALAPEAFGWDEVMKPMTLNYYQAAPLSQAVTQLETATKLTIIIDHQSFHQALCPFASVRAAVQCDQGTVNDTMELLLASVDTAALAYRIIDSQTLEITTTESAGRPEKMVMEVHRYQLGDDETPEEIVRSLRSAVIPESWAVSELPETKYGGSMVIDAPSGCLFVRQSQPAQRQIRLYLSTPEQLVP